MWNSVTGWWSKPAPCVAASAQSDIESDWNPMDHTPDCPNAIRRRTWESSLTNPHKHQDHSYRYLVCNFMDPFSVNAHKEGVKLFAEGSEVFLNLLNNPSLINQIGVVPCNAIDQSHRSTNGMAGFILSCSGDDIFSLNLASEPLPPAPSTDDIIEFSFRDFINYSDHLIPNQVWIRSDNVSIDGAWYKVDEAGNPLITRYSLQSVRTFAEDHDIPLVPIKETVTPIPLSMPTRSNGALKLRRFKRLYKYSCEEQSLTCPTGSSRTLADIERAALFDLVSHMGHLGEPLSEQPFDRGWVVPTHTTDPEEVDERTEGNSIPRRSSCSNILIEMIEDRICEQAYARSMADLERFEAYTSEDDKSPVPEGFWSYSDSDSEGMPDDVIFLED